MALHPIQTPEHQQSLDKRYAKTLHLMEQLEQTVVRKGWPIPFSTLSLVQHDGFLNTLDRLRYEIHQAFLALREAHTLSPNAVKGKRNRMPRPTQIPNLPELEGDFLPDFSDQERDPISEETLQVLERLLTDVALDHHGEEIPRPPASPNGSPPPQSSPELAPDLLKPLTGVGAQSQPITP